MDTESITSERWSLRERDAVREMSRALAARFGVRHALLVDHGSTAIRAAIWGIRSLTNNAELSVAAPCNVWRGVYSAIAFAGARRLRLVDVDALTGVLSPTSSLTGCDAVVVVDGFARRGPVRDVASNGLFVIEDASLSQTPSVGDDGRLAASVAVMSLQSNKLLSCGEGGLVLTDDSSIALAIEAAVCDGRRWLDGVEEASAVGFNGMMSQVVAEYLEKQVGAFDSYLRAVAEGADRALAVAGRDALPRWVDPALVCKGAFFALPICSSRLDAFREMPLTLGVPYAASPEELKNTLSVLPVNVETASSFQGAQRFAKAHVLLSHWELAAFQLSDSDD